MALTKGGLIHSLRGGGGTSSVATFSDLPDSGNDGDIVYVENEKTQYIFSTSKSKWVEFTGAFRMKSEQESVVPSLIAEESGTVSFIARSPEYPHYRDYAGTIPDSEFTAQSLPSNRDERGMISYRTSDLKTSNIATNETSLEITGAGTFRALIYPYSRINSKSFYPVTFAADGEAEADNYLYRISINDESNGTIGFFVESGSGNNLFAAWETPTKSLRSDVTYCVEFQRDSSGDVRAFLNGEKLRNVVNTTNVTDQGDGVVSGLAGSGGSAAGICMHRNGPQNPVVSGDWRTHGVHILNEYKTIQDAKDYAEKNAGWTPSQEKVIMTPDSVYNDLASEEGALFTLKPNVSESSGVEDLNGLIASGDWDQNANAISYIGDSEWLTQSTKTVSGLSELYHVSDLTIRSKFRYDGNNNTLIEFSDDQENLSGNILYGLAVSNSSTIRYIHEVASGQNVSADFNLESNMKDGGIYTISIRRIDNGDGTVDVYCIVNKNVLQVASVTNEDGGGAVDNGTYATLQQPEGDDTTFDQWLDFGQSPYDNQNFQVNLFGQVLTQSSTETREKEVHDKLGYTSF
jgi:hypothetical protein